MPRPVGKITTMTLSLSDRIIRYLVKKQSWTPSIEIQEMAITYAHQTGKTCSRRLQELVEDGKLDVDYSGKRGAASYKIKEGVIIPKQDPDYIQGVGILKTYEQLQKEGLV